MQKIRRYELDWLRVFAFFLLILFHSGMPYVTYSWHINNNETSIPLTYLWSFFHDWRMPLLFMISGCGIWFALGNRGGVGFLKERSKRLLLPLVFGVFVIVPPQVYLQRLSEGVDFKSYIDFYPHFFDGHIFAGGNFTPNHLWFIYALFFYCVVALPLFLFLKSTRGKPTLDKIASVLSRTWGIYLTMIPLYLSLVWLKPYGKEYVFEFYHLVLVIIGFIIVSRDSIMQNIEAQRKCSLLIAIAGISLSMYLQYSSSVYNSFVYYLPNVVGYLSLLFAIIGYAKHYLNFSNAFIKYCNEGVYPFYILHQTITVILAYYIVQWDMNLWFKLFLTTAGTVMFTLIIYHFAIRPFNVIRPLFGLKNLDNKSIEYKAVTVPVA